MLSAWIWWTVFGIFTFWGTAYNISASKNTYISMWKSLLIILLCGPIAWLITLAAFCWVFLVKPATKIIAWWLNKP